MTFEERMERLAARHEALAQTVELIAIEIRELRAAQEKNDGRVERMISAIEIDAENIRALARIAESHERRLTNLEGPG